MSEKSKDLTVKGVKEKLEKFESIREMYNFIRGDKRTTVMKAYESAKGAFNKKETVSATAKKKKPAPTKKKTPSR